MRNILILAGTVWLCATLLPDAASAGAPRPALSEAQTSAAPTDLSAQRRKRARRPASAPSRQIACTRFGCSPIPRGCRIVGERTWDGSPSGFDAVVCPRR